MLTGCALLGIVITTLYVVWDPRSHAVFIAPVLAGEWQEHPPGLNPPSYCPFAKQGWPYNAVRLFYPTNKPPTSAFYYNADVGVGFWATDLNTGVANRNVSLRTVAATRSGTLFDIIVNRTNLELQLDFQKLEFLDPCGPGIERTSEGKPTFRIVPYEPLTVRDPNHFRVLAVVAGTRQLVRECTVRIRNAIQLPFGNPLPDLSFKTIRVSWTPDHRTMY
jgi:hypothetical protein